MERQRINVQIPSIRINFNIIIACDICFEAFPRVTQRIPLVLDDVLLCDIYTVVKSD
jgi:hypothetical protein